jgi:hypothetical protein
LNSSCRLLGSTLCGVKPSKERHTFKLISTMRRGSSTNIPAAWARYPTLEAARDATATLLRDDRIVRVMIVRNEVPPAFVEWSER